MNWKYRHYISQLRRTTKKVHENFVVSALFHDDSLRHLAPYTQFYVKRTDSGYALLDLYYPQIHVAIEIDEPFHDGTTEYDNRRQRIVSDKLSCDFHRIKISEPDILGQISRLKKKILERTEIYKSSNRFREWIEPRTIDMEILKSEFSNTIFVRVIGEVHPDALYARETGSWKLAEYRRVNLKRAVVVHNGMITRIFENLKWRRAEDNHEKWRFDAEEVDGGSYIGTKVEGWKSQGSFTYANDV